MIKNETRRPQAPRLSSGDPQHVSQPSSGQNQQRGYLRRPNQHGDSAHQQNHSSGHQRRPQHRQNQPRSLQALRNQVIDSNGPEVKIRGTIYQILEKYLGLAREASVSGDRILSENLLQHGEHYARLINDVKAELAQEEENRRRIQQMQQPSPDLPMVQKNTVISEEDPSQYQPIL